MGHMKSQKKPNTVAPIAPQKHGLLNYTKDSTNYCCRCFTIKHDIRARPVIPCRPGSHFINSVKIKKATTPTIGG